MSLYAIGDLHLHFQSELKASGQLHDPVWKNHEVIFKRNCEKLIKPEDTLLLAGDHSWGRNMSECTKDLEYICSLPGRKSSFSYRPGREQDAKKTASLNQQFESKLFFLQNNYAGYRDYALVGTKGYTFEGPFFMRGRKIVGWDHEEEEHAQRLIEREAQRLRISFESAKKDGYSKFIMFLHYPPTSILVRNSVFTAMAEEYHAEQVIYAHFHGENRFHDSIEGRHHGIMYRLVSGDYLKWMPEQIL